MAIAGALCRTLAAVCVSPDDRDPRQPFAEAAKDLPRSLAAAVVDEDARQLVACEAIKQRTDRTGMFVVRDHDADSHRGRTVGGRVDGLHRLRFELDASAREDARLVAERERHVGKSFIDGQLHREPLGRTQDSAKFDGFHPLRADAPAGEAAEREHDPVDLDGSRHERKCVVVAVKVGEIARYDAISGARTRLSGSVRVAGAPPTPLMDSLAAAPSRQPGFSQTPDRSGWPSKNFGAGAARFTLPSGSRGTSARLYCGHCAASRADSAKMRDFIPLNTTRPRP